MSRWCIPFLAVLSFQACSSGPVQPRSSQEYRPVKYVEWIWCGALTSRSAEIKAKLAADTGAVRLRVSESRDLDDPLFLEPARFDPELRVAVFELKQLSPDSVYYYAIEKEGSLDLVRSGRLRTPEDGPFSFKFAFGSCARTASNAAVFDTIRENDPLFFVHLGDLHYADLTSPDPVPHRQVLDHVLASPAQSLLWRQVPVVYMWDDHDYGDDASDSGNPGRAAVRRTYRDYVPHYPLPAGDGDRPIYQAFSIGRVRFVVTDDRSERVNSPDPSERTMLGRTQKAWLEMELNRSRSEYPLVVWCNPVPWIGDESPSADHWGGFGVERRELAERIADSRADGLLMVSADAHMLAIDDGANSDYSDSGDAAFPVFQAAAFDRPGGVKGGPYSHGTIPGGGHFGLVEIDDRGDRLVVRLTGKDWRDRQLMFHEFTVPAGDR